MIALKKAYQWLRWWLSVIRDFHFAKNRLLTSTEITDDEKILIKNVSSHICYADTMYQGNAFHYLSVGLSSIRCIKEALRNSGKEACVETILDFPCGYGRVLRFLRTMFPNSHITAAEIDKNALNFCKQTFSATPFLSKNIFNVLNLHRQFDLIWCGSLITHINDLYANELLKFFYDHLTKNGICIFTTHGKRSIEWLQNKKQSYGLPEDSQQKIIRCFQSKGYGYADYPNQSGYGISVATHQFILELASKFDGWHESLFLEHGWDNHQDVYAFRMQK